MHNRSATRKVLTLTGNVMSNQLSNAENRSIEFVPLDERHGSARSLFTLWFGANMQVTCIAAGAATVAVGLPLPWAIVACIVGQAIGAIFMALHSAQGPILGIPQMIQSRAQFGFYGAVIPLLLVILMYCGFFATTAVQGGEAFSSVTGIGASTSTVLMTAVTVLLAIYGYRVVHAAEKWLSLISGVTFLYLTAMLIKSHDFSQLWVWKSFSSSAFITAAAIAATWQLTYAPYVADFSRYLPADTSVSKTFWCTYLGSVLASFWMFAFGAMCAAVSANAFDNGSVDFIVQQSPSFRPLIYGIIIAGVVAVNSMNLYGMFMSTVTTLNSLFKLQLPPLTRMAMISGLAIASMLVGLLGKGDFLRLFTNFILLLAYFIIPWTAINLADFYCVRKEKYSVKDMFLAHGEYGGMDWRALVPFFLGVVVEVPFISMDFYVGPVARMMNGADLSWAAGLIVSGGLYIVIMRVFPTRAKYPAAAFQEQVSP